MKTVRICILMISLFSILVGAVSADGKSCKSVLLLHSYDPYWGWTESVSRGITDAFDKSDKCIDLNIEYMDSKRVSDGSHWDNLLELYKHKFKDSKFQVIMTADDDAFNFILKNGRELFPESSLVFCGLTEVPQDLDLKASRITGVIEHQNMLETMNLAISLHPKADRMYIITDTTTTGRIRRQQYADQSVLLDRKIEIEYLYDYTMGDMTQKVQQLPKNSVVLYHSFARDSTGQVFCDNRCTDIISNCSVPVYSVQERYIGTGSIGGYVTLGKSHGQRAAKKVLQILEGTVAADIPVDFECDDPPTFDYRQLQRFGITINKLPRDSIILNQPFSFFREYRAQIITVALVFAVLLALLIALMITTVRMKFAQKVSESLARFPSEDPCPVLRVGSDGLVRYINPFAEKMLCMWNWDIEHPVPDSWQQTIQTSLSENTEQRLEVKCCDLFFLLTFVPVLSENYVNVYGREITQEKRASQQLVEHQAKQRHLASRLTLTEERERRRIASGLHDYIIQPLVFLGIKLDTLIKSVQSEETLKSYNQMKEITDDLIQKTRSFTLDLSYPILYEMGIEAAVEEWMQTNIHNAHGIKTLFINDEQEKPLCEDVRTFLFESVRELLVNVVKHGQANNVTVSINRDKDSIKIKVTDDGKGFSVNSRNLNYSDSGFGLFRIKERLDYLGGKLNINSKPGSGTTVKLSAPLAVSEKEGVPGV